MGIVVHTSASVIELSPADEAEGPGAVTRHSPVINRSEPRITGTVRRSVLGEALELEAWLTTFAGKMAQELVHPRSYSLRGAISHFSFASSSTAAVGYHDFLGLITAYVWVRSLVS